MNKNLTKLNAVMALLAVVASGCGGGGDSSPVAAGAPVVAPAPVVSTPVAPPAPTVATSPVVTVTASLTVPIVTSVPTPTYAVGSEELAAFNLLNAERLRCGFGMLAQNAALDLAAKSHADWLLRNGYIGHYQVPGTALYSGASPSDRMIAAGYSSALYFFDSNEVASTNSSSNKLGLGVDGVRTLLSAPYHMVAMLRSDIDVGVSVRSSLDVQASAAPGAQVVIDSGRKYQSIPVFGSKTGQNPLPGSLRTYPCEGTSGVLSSLTNETPNPTPGRDLLRNPVGSSIGVVVDAGHSLVLRAATITNSVTGAGVALLPVDNYLTNGVTVLFKNEGFITANAPLASFTTYKVLITGEDNGVAFTKTFTFTTGAAE